LGNICALSGQSVEQKLCRKSDASKGIQRNDQNPKKTRQNASKPSKCSKRMARADAATVRKRGAQHGRAAHVRQHVWR
jgi:hypothetical protein